MIEINAYAKINLHLDVTSKRNDGFHDIVSYMQTVSLCDTVTLEKAEKVHVVGNYGVDEKKDLAFRAACLFFDRTGISSGVTVRIDKQIPMQGGLAGGSTDAAAVLKGLNELYDTELPSDELAAMGATLGSDVPFCVLGGSKLASGRGEILEDAPSFPDCGILIVKGNTGMSTPAQYGMLDRIYNNFNGYKPRKDKLSAMLEAIESGNLRGACENLFNIFEVTGGYDEKPMNIMKEQGALGTLLSGSGGSVFGIFENIDAAQNIEKQLKKMGMTAFSCMPIAL